VGQQFGINRGLPPRATTLLIPDTLLCIGSARNACGGHGEEVWKEEAVSPSIFW